MTAEERMQVQCHKEQVDEFVGIEPNTFEQLLYMKNFQLYDGSIIQPLPSFCHRFYKDFLRIVLSLPTEKNLILKKELIMQPLPPQMGQLHFFIRRKKSLLNQTEYQLLIESPDWKKSMIVLYAYKKVMAMKGYYQIQLTGEKAIQRDSNVCLGKLRQLTNQKNRYVLYDNGDSYE